jgi:hypothetical protein
MCPTGMSQEPAGGPFCVYHSLECLTFVLVTMWNVSELRVPLLECLVCVPLHFLYVSIYVQYVNMECLIFVFPTIWNVSCFSVPLPGMCDICVCH